MNPHPVTLLNTIKGCRSPAAENAAHDGKPIGATAIGHARAQVANVR